MRAKRIVSVLAPVAKSLVTAVVAGSLMLIAAQSLAQTVNIFTELDKTIRAPGAVAKFGPDLFGDKVNLYNGQLSFEQTDVSLSGTGSLQVAVGRRLATGQHPSERNQRAFGVWDLDIPYLYGVFSDTRGWLNGANSTARCSSFSAPSNYLYQGTYTFQTKDYWNGNMMHVPGQGDQLMLTRDSTNTMTPSPASSYPVVTSQSWVFSCLATLANSTGAGEGFLALSPDGTSYRFDQMISLPYPTLSGGSIGAGALVGKPTAIDPLAPKGSVSNPIPNAAGEGYMGRKEVRLLPTLITDRYGNTVTFTYDSARPGNVTKITASDGRTLTFTYGNSASPYLITSVTDGTRTWSYTYSGAYANLDTVTLPDSSTWSLSGINPLLDDIQYIAGASCDLPSTYGTTALIGNMVHPSGASSSFTLTPTTHGRSNVPQQCMTDSAGSPQWSRYPRYFYTLSLTSKILSGPGIANLSWTYDYGVPTVSWSTCTSSCPSTKLVTVADPSSFVTRYTFGTVYHATDGKLQKEEAGWNGTSALRTTATRYRTAPGGAYPEYLGTSGTGGIGDADVMERPMPVDQRIVTQQGVNFTWEASAFDTYRRPLSVTKSSSLGSRAETTVYSDNATKWVLGQIDSVTETNTNKVMVKNTYDATTANLLTISNFGLLKETRTYNTNGTLLTSKDGLNQTTTYGSYKLGIPQLTTYADTKTTSAAVNTIGLITSTTNEVGYATSYGYDAMGRLSSITYPASDTVTWNITNVQFEKVATAEYGIGAGHWRTTVTTGNAKTISYLDAMWRPVLSRTYDALSEDGTRSMVLRKFDYQGATTFESYPQRTISAVSDTVNGTTYTLDALGRVTNAAANSELGVLNTSTAYNTGFQKVVTNARGYSTTYGYQAFDTPSEEALISIVQPYGFTTTITRDVFGKTTSIYKFDVNDGATRSYVYDANARLCKTIEPEIGATVLNYDAASNIAWRAIGVSAPSTTSCDQTVVAAKKITYGYDARNRLKTTTYGDASPSISRTLTADGLPETVSSNGTVWTYTYNKRRLLEKESLAYGNKTYDIGHSYNANGAQASLSYPGASTYSVAFAPNALGQATTVGSFAVNIVYSPNGAVNGFTYGSGTVHSRIETIRGMTYRVRDEGVMFDEYAYDENGSVTDVKDLQEGITNRTMTYDAVDGLQTATANGAGMWGKATYASDALGNIRTIKVDAGANTRNITLTYDANKRLSSISGTTALSLGYDSQGNLTSRGSAAYVFDQGNRMSSATGKASYVYDGWGRRVKIAKADGTNVIQVYSMDGELLYGTSAVGTATPTESRYVYLKGHLLGEAGVAYVHTDGLGSPIARTGPSGALLTRTRYEPYGLTAAGTAPTTVGFTGHVNDVDTALVYMQQRYYDPVVGRFMSIDPVTTDTNTGGSFNRYAYANNNPYKYTDPDGRFSDADCAAMVTNCSTSGGLSGGSASFGTVAAQRRSFGDGSKSSYDPNDVRGGFDENGKSLVYHPAYYDPSAAAAILMVAATSFVPEAGVGVEVAEVAAKIVGGERIGTALVKSDAGHRAASFLTKEQLAAGKIFSITGGDGVKRTLLQTFGHMNDKKGIYEYLVNKAGQVSHQRFIAGGVITGTVNQIVGD